MQEVVQVWAKWPLACQTADLQGNEAVIGWLSGCAARCGTEGSTMCPADCRSERSAVSSLAHMRHKILTC